MKKDRAIALIITLLIVLAGAVSYWSISRPSTVATESPRNTRAPIQKIRVANVGLFSNFNVIAERNGYFRQNGLDAEVDEYDSGGTSMAALLSDRADVAIAADSVGVANMFSHPDLEILAEVSRHDVWDVLARRDRNIKLPADLKGKKIGVTGKTAGEFYLGQFLTANGLKMADVKIADLSATDIVAGIEKGDIDAAVIFQPHGYDIELSMGADVISWPAQEGRQTLALAYARKPFIDAHPDVAEKYLLALKEAERFTEEQPAAAKAMLSDALGYDAAYLDFIWPKFVFAIALNQELITDLESQARWMIANRLTDRTQVPNYLDSIVFGPLEKTDPEAVTIIHQSTTAP